MAANSNICHIRVSLFCFFKKRIKKEIQIIL